jgi:hypothetical protein
MPDNPGKREGLLSAGMPGTLGETKMRSGPLPFWTSSCVVSANPAPEVMIMAEMVEAPPTFSGATGDLHQRIPPVRKQVSDDNNGISWSALPDA